MAVVAKMYLPPVDCHLQSCRPPPTRLAFRCGCPWDQVCVKGRGRIWVMPCRSFLSENGFGVKQKHEKSEEDFGKLQESISIGSRKSMNKVNAIRNAVWRISKPSLLSKSRFREELVKLEGKLFPVLYFGADPRLWSLSQDNRVSFVVRPMKSYVYYDKARSKLGFISSLRGIPALKHCCCQSSHPINKSCTGEKKASQKTRKKEYHLWHKRYSGGSGQKALNLVRIISGLPNEKEQVYSSLDKWIAWETEFPLVAAAKALNILRKRNQWERVIQVAKWMLSKGQGATLATYDCLLLAFDMDGRADEAATLWNMILHAHDRSISKRLFSRMISLYDHHNMPNMIIEVFADMEELGVRPDEGTVRRVARAFQALDQKDEQRLVIGKYGSKWKYIYFKGERVRVRTCSTSEIISSVGEIDNVHARD